jgi:hypothetical protein
MDVALSCMFLARTIVTRTQIGPESSIGFGRQFRRSALVSRRVEQHAPAFGLNVAAPVTRRWMYKRPLRGVGEKCFGYCRPGLTLAISMLLPPCWAVILVLAFELIVLRGSRKQLVNRGRSVVFRERVNAYDASPRVSLEARAELQPRDALAVNGNEVHSRGADGDLQLLKRAPVSASQ